MKLPVFTGSKVYVDPQNLIDEMWKVLKAMHVTKTNKVKFASYQLKDMMHIW